MKRTTLIHYDQMDVQKIVRDELERAKPDWVEEIVQRVSKDVSEKFDTIMTTLDKVMGTFESHDQEHTIIGKQLDDVVERTEKLEEQFTKLGRPVA
ncbi:hypothetical protein HY086_04390 [Candidatus Gottesmanbacteria bacterium]|nr:hypothetical protein [Candidatus Gottesmanbacteria bacterium]